MKYYKLRGLGGHGALGGSDVQLGSDLVFVVVRGSNRRISSSDIKLNGETRLHYSCHPARTTNYRAPTRFSRPESLRRLERVHVSRATLDI